MPAERFGVAAAVYGILRDGDQILLLRRAATGFRDGQLGLPAGHLDGGEDAVSALMRELREELGIEADPRSCRLALLMHAAPEHAEDREYFHLFFWVDRWTGEPFIAEPAKCSELSWSQALPLPPDLIDYVADALAAIARGDRLALCGW